MIFPSLAEIEEELNRPASLAEFPCAVLRNVTVEGLEPYLRFAGRRDGFEIGLEWGVYDNILQEAMGQGSGVIHDRTRAVVVCLWLPAFSEVLGFGFAGAAEGAVEREVERVREYCSATIRSLRQNTPAPILWLGFEPPAWPSYGVADARHRTSQRRTIAALNANLATDLAAAGNAFLVDTAQCLERVGARQFFDWRYWHIAHAPFSRAAMAELSLELSKHIRALAGRARKCLVLDCDNTLWGGVVGEDGVEGIRIGAEHPGSKFRDFQLEVLNLYHRGVILALCSKNNEQDVLDVFRSRPEMVLEESHFAATRINWHDKAANLRDIAAELNISLDSVVFADDSEFEIHLVEAALPEVETLFLSPSQPADHRAVLASCGWFDTLAITDEDRARGRMYRAEVDRKTLRTRATDLGEYLRSLEMRVFVQEVLDEDLDRAAQLCQRTNQFNLTTRRHTRDTLAAHRRSGRSTLLLLKLADRFGDYGTVGFSLMTGDGSRAVFDTFLMSCRVLGRGVETAFLATCAKVAASQGARTLAGCYIPTNKNAQVADFYSRHGFTPVGDSAGERWFEIAWSEGCISVPDYLSVIETVEQVR